MEEIHVMRNIMVCIVHQVYNEINILYTSSHYGAGLGEMRNAYKIAAGKIKMQIFESLFN
jgi:hypothetical protein